jgi:hypothetical protein
MKNIKYWTASTAFRKQFNVGRWTWVIELKRNDGAMGRVGGGWGWKLGIDASSSGTDFVVYLFIMSIRATRDSRWRK